jgi:predicted acetyltransferase
MTNTSSSSSFERPEVLPALVEEMAVIANLLELYAHDFSEFHAVELGQDGRYGYPDLPLYWREPGRHPFLIRVNGKLAGFALIREVPQASKEDAVWDMAEFFVLRAYRRRGVGMKAAQAIWRQFPGSWQVRVMQSNRAALAFWQRAISGLAGGAMASGCVENARETWAVFSFTSPAER